MSLPQADLSAADDTQTTNSDSSEAADIAREITQATDEGHDADIPSSIGYVLNELGELKRRRSIAEQRRQSLAHRPQSCAEPDAGPGPDIPAKPEPDDTEEDDANVVWWDGPDDPQNPYNWPTWRKTLLCGIISCMTFLTPLTSSIFAPGVPELMKEFDNDSDELSAFVVSVYVLGFAFGPLFLAPLSEIYGRNIVYHICNVGFLGFIIGSALAPSLNALIVFRFLSGIFGSCPITNGGGSIADMVAQEHRGTAMSIYSVGPLLGPIVGPIAGGFLASAKGWRWVFWLVTIVSGCLSVVCAIFMRETYAPVLLQRKTMRLRAETGNDLLRSRLDIGLSGRDYFTRGIVRPLKMIVRSPVVQICSLFTSVVYGYLYLLFTSITEVFEDYYNFSTDMVGLVYLGLGVGSLIGMAYFSGLSDRHIKSQAIKYGGGLKPEYRLHVLPVGAITMPIGFFIYGWTAQYHTHWIAPLIGMAVIGFGNLICFMCLQLYLVDAFTIYAASALAANTVFRSIAGAVLPLAGLRMYSTLGLGWGNSLLGFIAVALIPIPFLFLRYGEFLRKKFELKNL